MSLEQAVQDLIGKRLLIASDFDGTLAEIVDHPGEVVPNQQAVVALKELATKPETSVAIVSGRSRDDLISFLGDPADLIVIGEHGADTGAGEAGDAESITAIAHRLDQIAADNPGTEVEVKQMSVVFHYRRASGDLADALDQVRNAGVPEGSVSEGKKVVEVHVSTITKGDAIEKLREASKSEAVVFFGDDTTDETVFTRLAENDIGVKVGEGESAAQHRVTGVSDVANLLSELAETLA